MALDWSKYGTPALPPAKPAADDTPLSQKLWDSIAQPISQQLKQGALDVYQGVNKALTPPSRGPVDTSAFNLPEGVLQAGSGLATAITSPLAPIFAPIGKLIEAGVEKSGIGDVPAVQKFALSPAGEATARVAQDVQYGTNVASTLAMARGVQQSIQRAMVPKPPKPIEEITISPEARGQVIDNYNKAIKPTVVGKKTPQLLEKYNENVIKSVRSIVENKEKLSYITPEGETVTGRLPQTVGEMAQAIDQTKGIIFKQYNDLAKSATGQGATVSTQPALTQLQKVINSEALQLTHPEAITYAQQLAERMATKLDDGSYIAKQLNPDVVQDVIKNYNSSLESFYKNPTYENASKAAIEAGIMYQMREALDNVITNATGAEYQAIKSQYAALKQIEADVSKRAVVLARQQSATNMSGLADYAAIFSGGDIVNGILSLNPATIAKGTIQLGLTKLFSYLKSPDRAIQNMFKAADLEATKLAPQSPQSQTEPKAMP